MTHYIGGIEINWFVIILVVLFGVGYIDYLLSIGYIAVGYMVVCVVVGCIVVGCIVVS